MALTVEPTRPADRRLSAVGREGQRVSSVLCRHAASLLGRRPTPAVRWRSTVETRLHETDGQQTDR